MIVALDVHYWDDRARAAAVAFDAWGDPETTCERVRIHEGVREYRPGQFYLRELPCVLPLVESLRADLRVSTVVVDGYVDLDRGRPGLGRRLWLALDREVRVVGVAKNPFQDARALAVRRGTSERPLWVTATDDLAAAAAAVERMHGNHRMPDLLQRVDRLARDGV